jgi:hypothetical protein
MVAPKQRLVLVAGLSSTLALLIYLNLLSVWSGTKVTIGDRLLFVLSILIITVFMVHALRTFSRPRHLLVTILLSICGIAWLGPIAGATSNGDWTFLVSLQQVIGIGTGCYDDPYGGSSAQDCIDLHGRGSAIGLTICILLGVLAFVCTVQLVRLWVRKRLRS